MKVYLSALMLMTMAMAYSQQKNFSQLTEIQSTQQKRVKQGLIGLTSWGTLNVVGGLILRSQSSGETKYFHEMNAGFNSVNLILGVAGLFDIRKEKPQDYASVVQFQNQMEKVYLINSGLDVAYMASGWAIYNRGLSQTGEEQARSYGYGKSLVLQGGFLLAYDVFMLLRMRKTGKELNGFLSKIEVAPNGIRIPLD